ncbi:cytochrome c [Paraflavisolibacter sp. H34]|uniref:c-type cytochrome n=1 Tax=Huijunlia imazamoxiresistens TaxID=3127457 RepID=UPI00301A2D94
MRLLIICALMAITPVMVKAQAKKAPAAGAKKPAAAASASVQASVARGKAVYASACLACHQADGGGVPNLNPPLVQTSWVLGPKAVLIRQIVKGSSGTVEIDGERYHNTMPAMPHLTDQQIADVLTYVRNSFGNKASGVTPAEVKAIRAKVK